MSLTFTGNTLLDVMCLILFENVCGIGLTPVGVVFKFLLEALFKDNP